MSPHRHPWIELLACFEDGVTAAGLARRLGFSLPTAQRAITDYRARWPGRLKYDRRSRKHRLVKKPAVVSDDPSHYLDLLRGIALVEICAPLLLEDDTPISLHLTEHFRPKRGTDHALLICEALRKQRAITATYRSLSALRHMTLSPHRLIYASHRYHLRAFLHDGHGHCVDLVLGRFVAAEIAKEAEWVGPEHDHEWQQEVQLHVRLNSALPQEVRAAVVLDWQIDEEGICEKMPKPIAFYVRRDLENYLSDGKAIFIIDVDN